MTKTLTPNCSIGTHAIDFELPATDGKMYSVKKNYGKNGTLIMFICNHCPYVKAIRKKLVRDVTDLQQYGINTLAIMPNDPSDNPEDSFENMQKIAAKLNFSFPYLLDETQEVAKAYGAVCTPDFFGYNADLKLQYRGRLDDSGMENKPNTQRELFEAMKLIAKTQQGPAEQRSSIGCSIKWR